MKQKTKAEMETILTAYANYSGTKKAFCKEYGIKGHTLYYWQRKLSSSSPKQSSDFIKLEISDGVVTESISIYYPNGNRVTLPSVIDQRLLENLIRLNI